MRRGVSLPIASNDSLLKGVMLFIFVVGIQEVIPIGNKLIRIKSTIDTRMICRSPVTLLPLNEGSLTGL